MRQYIAETSAKVMGHGAPSQPKLQLQCTVSFFMDMGVCALSQGLKVSKGPLRGRGCAARDPSRVEKTGLNPILGVFWPFSDPKRCRVRSRWDFFCNFGAFGAYFGEK